MGCGAVRRDGRFGRLTCGQDRLPSVAHVAPALPQTHAFASPDSRPILSSMPELQDIEYVLERQPEGGYLIYVPELPGLATEGRTREEAIAMLRDALPAYLQSKRDRDQRRP